MICKFFKSATMAFFVILVCFQFPAITWAGGKARVPAIESSAERLVELQRFDLGWEGTWHKEVGGNYSDFKLTGVTALGLLEAYRDRHEESYLDSAKLAASFISEHLGAGAAGNPQQFFSLLPAADIVFLYRLGELTGDGSYRIRAQEEWDNFKRTHPTAGDLDYLLRRFHRPSAWDLAFSLEAAYLSGDMEWADEAAEILATLDDFYYSDSTDWYALNVASAIRALVSCGYTEYLDSISYFLGELVSLVDDETGIGGHVQDTAYAVLAFNAVGGNASSYANTLAKWLAANQTEDGGWLEAGYEYLQVDGEVLRALCSTIGTDLTIDGFKPGAVKEGFNWTRSVVGYAEPLVGEIE